MNINRLAILSLFVALFIVGCTNPEQETPPAAEAEPMPPAEVEEASWTYEGTSGPDAWGSLSAEFESCSAGVEQSPIALMTADATTEALPALELNYGDASLSTEDTGHGYKATPSGEHMLMVGEDTYNLLQLHPHTPSEHTLNGESFPMEVHFVHQNDAGALAVVGVMIQSGEANEAYADFTALSAGTSDAADPAPLRALLPEGLDYMTYPGSLTTPPCSEGVRWIVLSEPITMSPEQIDVFASAHGMTNRPVQPLNERSVRISE